ncbi:LysR family transcriptional regulator [Arthrobacter sp. AL08]|uniref:LysR family transcriptional regulator n=1 Tax=Micrococcaceae TaxID=1268 RepID=UPI001CFFDAC5|nr:MULTISPECIES: LysR family transcriptional regulator [Micrococcaceae]MCB5283150.1 HTH-type transcriptional regulator CynR [Arthrobacter sp. ES1]MDI3240035.1 LysR family transcriptional regulator [Arthrobacter sp. AL05]MDI3276045.1 LysR family transcriptional regulator [Arthrobacter sp. AL08]MDJ0352627.1 LysR family transcriptional regulator [Pseudarthrobacter sp. PH31-O2]WGZ78843.1 LysR family transcriptional regulator [Arthrobacter sp. EM1]
MTLAQLRAFLAAYELGSFTAAARKLETSQASVSELISRLEHELEHSLFIRGGRRLLPTTAAVELQVHALQSVTSFDNGVEALKSMSSLEGGVCTFGVLRYGAYYDLADLVQRFHRRYPKVKVRLIGLNSLAVAESVASGEIEAGLIVLPVAEAGLQVRPLFRDEVFYVSATRNPSRGPVTIEEFAESKLVLYDAFAGWRDPTRRQILERARLKGLKIDAAIEVEHVDTALGLVAAGAADSFVPHALVSAPGFPKNVHAVPFAEPLFDTIALVQREGAYLSPATRKMAQMAARTLLSKVPPGQDIRRATVR